MSQIYNDIIKNPWLWFTTISLMIVIGAYICTLLIRFALYIVERRLDKRSFVVAIVYNSIKAPIKLSVWILAAWLIVQQYIKIEDIKFLHVKDPSITVMKLGFAIAFMWTLFRFANQLRDYFIKINTRTDGGYNDYSLVNAMHKVGQIIILVVMFFIFMSILKIPLGSLAVISGAALAFFAFSQQALIQNLFGGLVLYLDRPFSEGDWINSMDNSFAGTVEKISFRITRCIGFDQRPFYVPNSVFLTTVIVNNNRMNNRRILQYVSIRHQDFDKLEGIMAATREYLAQHPRIAKDRTTLVNVVNGGTNIGPRTEGVFGQYAINFMVYTFTDQTNWVEFQNLQDDIMIGVGKIVRAHGAELAVPVEKIQFGENEIQHFIQAKDAIQSTKVVEAKS